MAKTTFGLTFLDPQEVLKSFVEVSVIPEGLIYCKYADYLTDNYISKNSVFPRTIWSNFSTSISRRTNDCESFHAHFIEHFNKSHPNINTFLQLIHSVKHLK